MKGNFFLWILGRLKVDRKLLVIYLLDLSAVLFISGILIHEKYIAINFSDKEIAGNHYVHTVRDVLLDVARINAGETIPASKLKADTALLAAAEREYGAAMESTRINERARTALDVLARQTPPTVASANDAMQACRELIARVGNQSNLILDPDLDSYYVMSMSILRYPALLERVGDIGKALHEMTLAPSDPEKMHTRYLLLEGQLDAVSQGLKSDFGEATAANHAVATALGPVVREMLASIETYREAARLAVYSDAPARPAALQRVDVDERAVLTRVHEAWRKTGASLDDLLMLRVHGLFLKMWLHLGTVLFLLCAILSMVYIVAQQISRPLRHLARVMDTVRRTGDHSLRATWHSQDEIGQLVNGFNEMLEQLGHERDIQKELAATARASEAQHTLVEATPVPMMVTAIPGHEILHSNKPALFWLNGCTSDPWAHGLDSAVRARFFQQLSDYDAVDEFEVRWQATTEPTWAMLSARRLTFQGRDAVLTAFTPINQIKLMEQRLELWAKVFEASSESILILDENFCLLTANAAFFRTTGYTSENVTGKRPDFLVIGDTGEASGTVLDFAAMVGRAGNWHGEARVLRRQGQDYPAWLIISAVRDRHGHVSHMICTLIDVTERKRSEARIQFLAEHDVLTELPNRALFCKRLGAELNRSTCAQPCAVLFVDLDRFKNINDSLGHHIGDGLLRSVSRRLLAAVRSADTVSRFGGDEFTLILSGIGDAANAARIIEDRILPLLREPHQIEGTTVQISCSVGVAMYPDDGADIGTLMQNADVAMYQAKTDGRNLVRFFSSDMAERTQLRLSIEAGLQTAIERGELHLAYQPCLDARSGAIVSVEGLLRWNSPELGAVSPAQFIPVAEETGMIVPIGAWVIDEACRQMARWRADNMMEVKVSINVSAMQLRELHIVDTLRESLGTHGIAPEMLELEITETVLMDGAESYLEAINALRELGVKLSLDDFGTGYSSLSYLNRFRLDRLKIDRAFVHDKLDTPAGFAVIKSIVELGHKLEMRVVAEGVESEREAQILRTMGCDELQGFLFSKALPADQLRAWARGRLEAQAMAG